MAVKTIRTDAVGKTVVTDTRGVPQRRTALFGCGWPLRVLHVVPYLVAGGIESWIGTLDRNTPGVEHSIASSYWMPDGLAMLRDGSVPVHLPQEPLDPHTHGAEEWLRGFLAEHPEFDVIHVAYNAHIQRIAREDGRPVVLTIHGQGHDWPEDVPPPDAVSVVGSALARDGAQVIVNGVDAGRFGKVSTANSFRSDLGIPAGAFTVLWVSRLHPTKGIELFERVACAVLERLPDAHLIAVGHGIDSAAEEWMARLAQEPRVHWMRGVPCARMPALYASAQVLIHTSPDEGFGLVVAEAGAAGLPVVAVANGGTREIVLDGQTGRLVGPDDAELMAEAVARYERDAHFCYRHGEDAAVRVRGLFAAKRMGREYADLYRQVTSRPARAQKPKGVVVYSGQEWSIYGGGQTTTQLALAFRRRGYEVLFVPYYERSFRGTGTGAPPPAGVHEVALAGSWPAVEEFVGGHNTLWLCGLPTRESLIHLRAVRGRCATVYHIRDDWAAFNDRWWNAGVERYHAAEVDALAAITPQYRALFGERCHVLPNAHDPGLFHFRERRWCPENPTVVYWGSYSKLFWRDDLFRAAVAAFPSWQFVLVGGYAEDHDAGSLPGNVELLGWQPIEALDAIAARCDLGFVPFGTRVSERCDIIKGHEFNACGLPFVSCGCPAVGLLGIPAGYNVAPTEDAVIEGLRLMQALDQPVEAMCAYAQTDTWDGRAERLESWAGM